MSEKLVLDGGQIDTLVALVEQGPVWDGDVPSKRSRDELVTAGYAVRVVVKGEQGYAAATYKGTRAYCEHFGNSDTISEAKSHRVANLTIRKAKVA